MEQLIPVIEFVKKNRFWLASGVLAVAMIVAWFLAVRTLDQQRATYTSQIAQKIQSIQTIKSTSAIPDKTLLPEPVHPNEQTLAGMRQEIRATAESVLRAWELRYKAQKKIRKWPKEIATRQFLAVFGKYEPPEIYPIGDSGLNVQAYLRIYKKEIPKTMDRLSAIIRADWKHKTKVTTVDATADDDNADDSGDAGDETDSGDTADAGENRPVLNVSVMGESDAVVEWNEENQDLWWEKMTSFKGRDDNKLPTNDPSPSQMFMLQQDLWLLEAMFNVVKTVNGEADANDLAVIKTIDHVVFGREALGQLGELEKPDPNMLLAAEATAGAGTAEKKDDSGIPQGRNELDRGRREARRDALNQPGTGAASLNLTFDGQPAYHYRYVDPNFEPIPAETVHSILTGKELPTEHIELVVAKRVPFRFACQMDERKIPEFLNACSRWGYNEDDPDGISPFVFEVTQVRINKHVPMEGIELQGANSGGAGGAGEQDGSRGASAQMGGQGMGLDGGGETSGDSSSSQGGISKSESTETRTTYDVAVEFYGIVRIYNPVRPDLLLEDDENIARAGTPATQTTSSPSSRP